MPYRRKYRKNPRRRNNRRNNRKMRLYRRPYATKRTGFLSVVQKDMTKSFELPAGAYPSGYIQRMIFNISNVVNLAEFTRLFDQYRIRAVSVKLMPQSNTNDSVNPALTYASSIDLDGGSVNTWSDLLACSNCKVGNWSNAGGNISTKSHYLKPRWRNVHIIDPTTTPPTYGNTMGARNKWIDLADQGQTDHYGLNIGFLTPSGVSMGFAQDVSVITTYYIQFRKVR